MGNVVATAFLVTAFTAAPLLAFGAAPAAAPKVANHATVGVVKSMSDTTLVISRTGKKKGEMTFVVQPSTTRQGALSVGSTVSVRYHADGKMNVATAISERPKPKAAARKKT
jgi:hypothetical protein